MAVREAGPFAVSRQLVFLSVISLSQGGGGKITLASGSAMVSTDLWRTTVPHCLQQQVGSKAEATLTV